MLRIVTEPSDPGDGVLYYGNRGGPLYIPPSRTPNQMNSIARFVSAVSLTERFVRELDWADIRSTVSEGLRIILALAIVAGIYAYEGTVAVYNWAQPRLAGMLQHPGQTIIQGPVIVYAEAVENVLRGDSTPIQRWMVSVVSTIENVVDSVQQWNENLIAQVNQWRAAIG